MTAPVPLAGPGGLSGLGAPLGEAQALLGAVGAVAPAAEAVLPGMSGHLGAALEILPAAVAFAETAWEGAAALGAQESLTTASASLVDLGTSAVEIGGITHEAALIVLQGAAEVAGIASRFATQSLAVLPTAATPAGQIALVGLAAEALTAALAVVERVRAALAGPTARMWAIAAELGTAPRARVPGTSSPWGSGSAAYELAGNDGTEAGAGGGSANGTGNGAGNGSTSNASASGASGTGYAGTAGLSHDESSPGAGDHDGGSTTGESGSHSSADGVVGAGTSVTLPSGSVVTAPNPQAASAVTAALGQQGVPYSWGGTTPGVGFDCSGLVQWAYGEAGVEIPRTAMEQAVGTPVSREELLPGDLVVWDGHVAMCIGDDQIVEAGDPVQVSSVRTDNIGMQFLGFYRPTGAS